MLQGIDALRQKKDLTIITNSLPMAYKCNEMNFDVVLVGGKLHKNGLHTDGFFSEKCWIRFILISHYLDPMAF